MADQTDDPLFAKQWDQSRWTRQRNRLVPVIARKTRDDGDTLL